MNKTHSLDWQNPFVDIFERFSAFDSNTIEKKGNVDALQVKLILTTLKSF